MERLTQELYPGDPTPKHYDPQYMKKIVSSLADYERTCLTPEQVRELKERDTAKPARPISDRSLYAICLNCGQTIFKEYRFCPECGQRLKMGG